VREAWSWSALGWALPTLTLLLPGAWWIAHPEAPLNKRVGVIGFGFLGRLILLGSAAGIAAAQGMPARGAYLAAMGVTYLMLQSYETLAFRRHLRETQPSSTNGYPLDRTAAVREGV